MLAITEVIFLNEVPFNCSLIILLFFQLDSKFLGGRGHLFVHYKVNGSLNVKRNSIKIKSFNQIAVV